MGNNQDSSAVGGGDLSPNGSAGGLSSIGLTKKRQSIAGMRKIMIKPLTKELTDKEVEFIANNSSLSRAEIEMWHQKFLVCLVFRSFFFKLF
jgi:hypothetical protein